MKYRLIFLSVLFVSGCANMEELRNKNPDLHFSSQKSVQDVSACILSNWQSSVFRYGNVFIQDGVHHEGGKTIYSESQSEMVDVLNEGEMRRINFYHQSGLFAYRVNERVDGIKKCL